MPKYNEKKYQFGRAISAVAFTKAFHPTIKGRENIPSDGPLIFCGNHLHVWDQYPVMCATKVTIHWMAKKEYFESKLGPIFKFMGCICVDRQNNPHESKEIAIEYLREGHNIGLFAEGTRNGLKDNHINDLYTYLKNVIGTDIEFEQFKSEIVKDNPRFSQIELIKKLFEEGLIPQSSLYYCLTHAKLALSDFLRMGLITTEDYNNSLLLPLKYGAVSMAQEADARIVPFAVTGDYKTNNNNLMVNFGEAFKVEEDLSASNEKLKQKILTLVNDNYQSRP